jgi:hypothetical protein
MKIQESKFRQIASFRSTTPQQQTHRYPKYFELIELPGRGTKKGVCAWT